MRFYSRFISSDSFCSMKPCILSLHSIKNGNLFHIFLFPGTVIFMNSVTILITMYILCADVQIKRLYLSIQTKNYSLISWL